MCSGISRLETFYNLAHTGEIPEIHRCSSKICLEYPRISPQVLPEIPGNYYYYI
jgi:hypothetical protein